MLLIATLVMLLYVASFNHNGHATGLDRVSLRLPIPVVDTAFAPYYLAIDKGIFAKYGIDVKLEPGTPDLNPVKMVSQNSDQFGVLGGPELLLSGRAKGAPIVGIALIHKDSDFVIVLTLKESGITSVQQLRGKKVGFFFGHISTDVLRMVFSKEDVKVQEVDVGFDYGPFLAKQLDAQWAFRTTAGISLPAKGVQLNVISPAEYGIVTQGHMVITNESMLREQPDVVRRFTAALREALAFSVKHPEESVTATIKRDPNFQREVGEKQLEIYNAAILRNNPLGWISFADMEKTKQQMVDVGLLAPDFDITSSYTTRFLE